MKLSFDECFQVFPPIDPPAGFDEFWKQSRTELKKIPVDPKLKIQLKKSIGRDSLYEISFLSHNNERIQGFYSVPKLKGKVPVIITFHDYHYKLNLQHDITHTGCAHLAITLRHHTPEMFRKPDPSDKRPKKKLPLTTSGLFSTKTSYPYACYLDALRCLDFIRLQKSVQTNNIGIIGHGYGAAMAIFLAAMAPESIKALSLERPSFVWHNSWMEDSSSDLSKETTKLLRPAKKINQKVKKNLAPLDPLLWSEKLNIPVICMIGLEDQINPPRPAFGFFNHLKTQKDMEIFPDDSVDPKFKLQRQKSFEFLTEKLIGPVKPKKVK